MDIMNILTQNGYTLVTIIGFDKEKALLKCKDNETNKEYALKRLLWSGEANEFETLRNKRLPLWQNLKHPNIIELSNYFEQFDNNSVNYFMAVEFCDTSLHEWLKSPADRALETCESMILEIIAGLSYLHEQKITHGNLKPLNIQISRDGVCKLADYDFTGTNTRQSLNKTNSTITSNLYNPPEPDYHDIKADIYPFGIIIMEFFTRLKTIDEKKDAIKKLRSNKAYDRFFDNFDRVSNSNYYANLKQLIVKMIQNDPKYRPDMAEVKRLFYSLSDEQQIPINDNNNNNDEFLNTLRELNIEQQDRYGQEFVELGRLGKGSYGVVYKVQNKCNREYYAIKKVNLNAYMKYEQKQNCFNAENTKKILREIINWKHLKHKSIVDYKLAWFELNRDLSSGTDSGPLPALHIQMQLCECTLDEALQQIHSELDIHDKDITPVEAYLASHLFIDIAEGVDYLHSRDPAIMHRDIKMNNILLAKTNDDWTVKISDFGLTKTHNCRSVSLLQTVIGGYHEYRAPEIKTGEYCEKVDIYSLGVLHTNMCKINRETREKWMTNSSVEYMAEVEETHELYAFYRAMKTIFENVMKLFGSPEERPSAELILQNKNHYILCYDFIKNNQVFQKKFVAENSGLMSYALLGKYIAVKNI